MDHITNADRSEEPVLASAAASALTVTVALDGSLSMIAPPGAVAAASAVLSMEPAVTSSAVVRYCAVHAVLASYQEVTASPAGHE